MWGKKGGRGGKKRTATFSNSLIGEKHRNKKEKGGEVPL